MHNPRVRKDHPAEAWGSKTAAKGHVPGDDGGEGRPVASVQTARVGGSRATQEGRRLRGLRGVERSAGQWRWRLLMGDRELGGPGGRGSSSEAQL